MIEKKIVLKKCLEILSEKLSEIRAALADLKESVENEDKSTAGDKHDTARAMIHLEQEKLAKQLNSIEEELNNAKRILSNSAFSTVQFGSLVETDLRQYLIGPALGVVKTENASFVAMSPAAPLAQQMLGKRVGDLVEFNGSSQSILTVI
jgi:transcription elongation GreA/GreB family factor